MRHQRIPLAVAAVALLAACTSSPSVPAPPSSSTGTAITASSHVAEHTAPSSHSPIPARTTPRKATSTTTKPAPLAKVTPKPSGVLLTTGKPSTYSVNDLVIGDKSGAPKYLRDSQFGKWADTDGNHCDTRNDVLKRDLQNETFVSGSNCLVKTGELFDAYTGDRVDFVRGAETSRSVQIDHVVSVADAWRSGAWKWTPAKRIAFYNDPLNLLAVEGAVNESKSDKTADQYMPPQHKCEFAMTQIAVKDKYSLIVTQPEMTALNFACGKG